MKRIGILGVDALTEKLIRGFFQAAPDAQVFLFPANSERAQRLAREFPCWTQDNHQAVIDEVDVIIISVAPDTLNELSGSVQLRNSQTLISLVPGIQSRALGNDSNLLIVFYVQIMPDDFVMQLHRF